jgi:hypothetical protein
MDEAELRSQRRGFIRANHPDRGGDPVLFEMGLRQFERAAGARPRVVGVPTRSWPVRLLSRVVSPFRSRRRPPRVR